MIKALIIGFYLTSWHSKTIYMRAYSIIVIFNGCLEYKNAHSAKGNPPAKQSHGTLQMYLHVSKNTMYESSIHKIRIKSIRKQDTWVIEESMELFLVFIIPLNIDLNVWEFHKKRKRLIQIYPLLGEFCLRYIWHIS